MTKKIAIMVDSSADITRDEAKEMGVYVIRMPIMVDGRQYIEELEINDLEIAKMMRNGAVVKTAQPVLGDIGSMWNTLLEKYDQIVYIPLSSQLSGTYQTSYIASKEFENRVFVVDARIACAPFKVLIKYVKEMIKAGYDGQMIKDKVEKEASMFAIIVPENLTYLKRGGRISPAAAALGNMLKIVPVLKVENGAIDVETKVRTTKKAYQVAMEHVANVENKDDYEWMMLSVDNDISEYKKEFEAMVQKEVIVDSLKAVIMCHVGPGTFALGRIKKIKV